MTTRLSWTQPICETCWPEWFPFEKGEPTRLLRPEKERCSFCGEDTTSGIYVRFDPLGVRFPAEKEE